MINEVRATARQLVTSAMEKTRAGQGRPHKRCLLNKFLKERKGRVMRTSVGRTFQGEGRASSRTQRWERVWVFEK